MVALASALTSCSKQGEGERCDPRNDNEDCESGLICRSLRSLNQGIEGAVCCPDQGSSSAQICERADLAYDETVTDENASSDPANASMGDAAANEMSTDDTTDAETATDETAATEDATDPETTTDEMAPPDEAETQDTLDAGADAGNAPN